jgi:hypothetical protein
MSNGSEGFFAGFSVALIIFLLIMKFTWSTQIADKDLYRFCLYNNMKLENCKLPPKPLDANEKK